MMGEVSKGSSLTDTVFSWSLDDIYDDHLYKYQVENIPTSFQSLDQYSSSFVYPLLEETRTAIYSSMETISLAPFAEVITVDTCKRYGTLLYEVKVEYWRNRFSDRGREPYRTLPGDILVFSEEKPETVSDLQRVGRTWTFAEVINISEDENEESSPSTQFKVKAFNAIEDRAMMGKSLFVMFLINITTNKRIWKGLQMSGNLQIIKEVLCTNSEVPEECDICSQSNSSQLVERFGKGLFSELNESQTKAISVCLDKMTCDHKSSVELIWGPPGTGKTKTVSIMLYTFLRMKCRTLACAPTNIAITEVASRVVRLVQESFGAESSDVGNFLSLGDILLFGNKDRLKVGSVTEEIFLDYRLNRLTECVGPITGWQHCLTSMIDFLEDGVSQYKIYVENELIKAKGINGEEESGIAESKSFLTFARDRFSSTSTQLKRCIYVFCTHLPRTFILEHNFQNMLSLDCLLDSFEKLLFKDNVVSEELLELLSHEEVVECSTKCSVDKSSLLFLRSQSLSILRTLRCSLQELDIPHVLDRDAMKEFCFRKASLILCTASSSYKLHSVVMEPLELLVIDEAAQLKECESTIPLQLSGMRHTILIGDECQLPAMVESKVSAEAGFGRSLFERLSSLGHAKHLLNMQYRMHPAISLFPNSNFYLGQILDAQNVKEKNYERRYLPGPMFGPYSFINVIGGKEEIDDVGRSRRNLIEVALVLKILQNLYRGWSNSKSKLAIGVVSPYAAQVLEIQDKLGRKYENLDGFTVNVKSIDGFQGAEEDIIIMSTVRCNSGGSIGFLASPQRINVALTRARHCLWILGSERTLENSESIWQALVHDSKKRLCFFNADEDTDMGKTIVEVKKELNQFDDLLKGNSILFIRAKWKVSFSDNFRKSFGKLKSDSTKLSVVNLLLKLSGGWRPRNRNVDSLLEKSSQILKQFKVEGFYVVCTIDVVKDDIKYFQVLKIWDILPLEEIPKFVKRLDMIFVMCTDDYSNRCKEKCFEGYLQVPKSWRSSTNIVRYKNLNIALGDDLGIDAVDGRNYLENSKVNESLLLMKFYPLSSGIVSRMLSDRNFKELDLPFDVTDQELEIIQFCKSTFILGRSGTGKTTVLTMKLFQKEQHQSIASERFYAVGSTTGADETQRDDICERMGNTERPVLRQLFVTVSPKLCYAVKQQVSKMKSFAQEVNISAENGSSDMDDMDEFKDIPDSFVDIPSKKYPLVITFFKFLMMLDGTLSNSFFDQFLNTRDLSHDRTRRSRSVALETFIRNKEVDYDKFCSSYWSHFNTQSTKMLDPARVFTEIISHIKGRLREGENPDGKLGREAYISLSEDRASTLSKKKRNIIYDIFQDYEKRKNENGEFDLADFVIDLHRRLKHERLDGDKMDFVYIDEVQDLTMRQIALFKYICRNVYEGFVFSGDTAQTIARGIDFRFEDIRSLFYNEFVIASRSDGASGRKEKGQLSDIFKLNQNFRTHAGVLNLTQSIIDLLYCFFPQSIDVLKPEFSLIYGEAPVWLEHGSGENAIVTIFGKTGNFCADISGFGAEQVILVRDEQARTEISQYVGKQALVLTVVECKGLEFQDVLLYNFFGSSPLKNKWRIIYEYMKKKGLFDSSSPLFTEKKHNVLCSELKQLYVAITRTRQRLWICENVEEFCKPMFDYWKKLGLVQVRKLDDSLAHAMQVASSPEEWKARGIKLFWENNYEMATMCFERAGDTTWEKRAKAAGLKAAADRMLGSNPEMAFKVLREAAEIFDSIGRSESAAECFCDLGEYERAGKIYLDKCGTSELRKAGECFSLAGCHELAAKVYARGNYFSECLSVCTRGSFFEIGLNYIQYWKQHALGNGGGTVSRSAEIGKMEQEFLQSCALHYHELNDNRSMMKFVKAFHDMNLRRNFLKSINCLDELLMLEEELGNFLEAAEIAKLRGDLLLQADLLGKAGQYHEASLLILWCALPNSLWAFGSKGWPLKQFEQKDELLVKAKLFAKKDSDTFNEFVCTEVSIISTENSNVFELNQCLIDSYVKTNLRVEILSTWRILDAHLHSKTSNYEWEEDFEVVTKSQGVSVERLICFWWLWKQSIMNIFAYLEGPETQENNEYLDYGEFCMNYFGVWRQLDDLNTVCLLNSEAEWVKGINKFLRRRGNLVTAEARHFVSAAQTYWRAELLAVGMKMLETLNALYQFSLRNSLSVFCTSFCLVHIYEVANFLLESKYTDTKFRASKTLQDSIRLSTKYFDNAFPLDRQLSLTGTMVSLKGAEYSRKLIEEVIRGNLKGRLTHGKIGRVVMAFIGSGKISDEICKEIVKRFDSMLPWKALFESLSCHDRAPRESSLVERFHKALEYTYNANWLREHDYISPNCFLYLIEHLLILVSYSNGFFFTTKSSFVEWFLSYKHLNLNSGEVTMISTPSSSRVIFEFVATAVHQFVHSRDETKQWIKNSQINLNNYYPQLLLRLIVILCLLCVNSGSHFPQLYGILSWNDITSKLPNDFVSVLRRKKGRYYAKIDIQVLAEALKKISDPLVIVSLNKDSPKYTCPHAINVDMGVGQSRKDIIRLLFPRTIKAPQTHDSDQFCALSTSELASAADQGMQTKTGNGGTILKKFGLCGEISDATMYLEKGTTTFKSNSSKLKVEVEETIKFLTYAFTQSVGNDFSEAKSMLLVELRFLSSALDVSDEELEKSIPEIGHVLRRLQLRRSWFETFVEHQIDTAKDGKAIDEAASEKNMENSQVRAETEAEEVEKLQETGNSTIASDDQINNLDDNHKNTEKSKGRGNNNKRKKNKKGRGRKK